MLASNIVIVSYIDLIQQGVPPEYRVLILPACLCLSDVEARQIKTFCRQGGTVIADYLPGLWDQHGKGRPSGGVLDDMFGIKHSPELQAGDIFGDRLWVEVDQDANYSWTTYEEFLTRKNTCVRDPSGFDKAVRSMPVDHVQQYDRGSAVLMNLSPQWYNAFRGEGATAALKRDTFLKHLTPAKVAPWVRIKDAGQLEHGYEITYWSQPPDSQTAGRTILFLCLNPEITGNALGGGNAQKLKTAQVAVTLQFRDEVSQLRDERSGKELGAGREFSLLWKQNEALVLSFAPSR